MTVEGTYAGTRVWGFNLPLDLVSGAGVESTSRAHWRFTYSYGELASGSSNNGNRLSGTNSGGTASGTYDAQDRMTAYGAATYTYGPSGDLRTRTAVGQTTTYSYDSLGILMGAWLPDGRTIEYVVDGLNRRVGKKVNGTLAEGLPALDQEGVGARGRPRVPRGAAGNGLVAGMALEHTVSECWRGHGQADAPRPRD